MSNNGKDIHQKFIAKTKTKKTLAKKNGFLIALEREKIEVENRISVEKTDLTNPFKGIVIKTFSKHPFISSLSPYQSLNPEK